MRQPVRDVQPVPGIQGMLMTSIGGLSSLPRKEPMACRPPIDFDLKILLFSR
jgi:hypothetical protein